MADAQQSSSEHHTPKHKDNGVISRGVLNVLLVFIESAITLILRFSPKLRQLAYPLAQKNTVVCLRTYLPHTQIYATFDYRGLLLDDEPPLDKPVADITINAYSFQLINALTKHSPDAIDALQIRGASQDVEHLKAFLLQLGVGGFIQEMIYKVKGKPTPTPTPQERTDKIKELKATIAEQSLKIDSLQTHNQRLNTQLAEAASKQKSTFIGFIIASLVAVIAIILHFFI